MKDIIKKLVEEFNIFFDANSEYGVGYLDALTEVCQRAKIPHKRLVDNLIVLDKE